MSNYNVQMYSLTLRDRRTSCYLDNHPAKDVSVHRSKWEGSQKIPSLGFLKVNIKEEEVVSDLKDSVT